jgi:hypothetical protein
MAELFAVRQNQEGAATIAILCRVKNYHGAFGRHFAKAQKDARFCAVSLRRLRR